MINVRTKLGLAGLFAMVATLTFSAVAPAAVSAQMVNSQPDPWNWQDVTPSDWADRAGMDGPMVWGDLRDSVAYDGDVYFAGNDSNSNGQIFRYDTTDGTFIQETLPDFDAGSNQVMSLGVSGADLYAGTQNNSGAELWMKHNGVWSRVAGFDSAATNIYRISSIVVFGANLCVSGMATGPQAWCRVSGVWTDTNLDGAGAAASYEPKLTVVGSKMYVNAQTAGNYHEIWQYNGTAWSMMTTPFTDSEQSTENRADDVIALGAFAGKVVAISQDNSNMTDIWWYDGATWTQQGPGNFNGDNGTEYGNMAETTVVDGKLVVGINNYADGTRIWEYDGTDAWTQRNDDFFGIAVANDGFDINALRSLTVDDGVTYAVVGATGEGNYYPRVWRTPPFVAPPAGDGQTDGGPGDTNGPADTPVANSDLPNNGDANGDGVNDSGQNNVKTVKSGLTDKFATLQVSNGCSISDMGLRRETDLAAKDSGFKYPNGLMHFDVNCGTPGFTTTVTQYYYDLDASGFVLRKFHPTNNAFFTIQNATVQQTVIGGHNVAKVTYQVTDGGELDIDGQVNGVIVDPAGLGSANVAVPDTGIRTIQSILFKR